MTLHDRLLETAWKRKLWNATMLCKAVNGHPIRVNCKKAVGVTAEWGNAWSRVKLCQQRQCRFQYFDVLKEIRELEKAGYLFTRKQKFYDRSFTGIGNQAFDMFRLVSVHQEVLDRLQLDYYLRETGV